MRAVRRRRLLAGVLAATVAGVLVSCGGDDTDEEPAARQSLRVAYAFGFDLGQVADRIAFEAAERRAGVRFELQELGNPNSAIGVLERGEADIVYTVMLAAAAANAQGADLRMILLTRSVMDFVLAADGVRDVSGLRGKSLGANPPGTETEALTRVVVQRAGLEGEVELVALPQSANRATALLVGRLDAAWIEYPDYLRIAAEAPRLTVVTKASDLVEFPGLAGFVVTKEFAEENRELLDDVVSGLLEGYATLYEPEGRKRWIERAASTYFEREHRSLAEQVYGFYAEVGMWPRRERPVTREQWDSRVRFWREEGILEEPAPFEGVWDVSFWERAADG